MSKRADAIADLLAQAIEKDEPVQIVRKKLPESDVVGGFVAAHGPRWVVVHSLNDGVHLDGLELIRTRQISSVRSSAASTAYVRRALNDLGRPEVDWEIDCGARTPEVLQDVAAETPLLGFLVEGFDPALLFIGRVVEWKRKTFRFQGIDQDGVWNEAADLFTYREVTRIQIGSRYIETLMKYGDQPGEFLDNPLQVKLEDELSPMT